MAGVYIDEVTSADFSSLNYISANQLIAQMQALKTWEDKYRYLIMLGKNLAVMPEHLKYSASMVTGCESQVWLAAQKIQKQEQEVYYFTAHSNARIVKGLLAIIIAAFNGKTITEIKNFDIDSYLLQLNITADLTSSRVNGMMQIVEHIMAL